MAGWLRRTPTGGYSGTASRTTRDRSDGGSTGREGRGRLCIVEELRKMGASWDQHTACPGIRQILQHWAYRITAEDLDQGLPPPSAATDLTPPPRSGSSLGAGAELQHSAPPAYLSKVPPGFSPSAAPPPPGFPAPAGRSKQRRRQEEFQQQQQPSCTAAEQCWDDSTDKWS